MIQKKVLNNRRIWMVAEKTRIEYSEACVEVIIILNQFPEEYYNKI